MLLGALLAGIGHMMAFVLKNTFISIRRFSMDPANKKTIWNLQAFSLLFFLVLIFLWLVGKYQDQIYGISGPVFYRAIPLLFPCFLGHIIYSCPALFKNTYAKPVIQTFLNAFSILALGQIIMHYTGTRNALIITAILLIGTVYLTLYYTLHIGVKATVFNRLTKIVEQSESQEESKKQVIAKVIDDTGKTQISHDEISKIDGIDLSKKGCLSHLRYYSEECKLELFHTVPTKNRQSQLMVLNRNDRAQHGQIIGGTGSGKTLLATTLIVQDLLNDYIGSTIIEPKGSLINRLANFMERTGRNYYRLDPEYELTDCLNPFDVPEGLDIEPMIEANVSAYHAYLGPDAVQYFKSRSTQLLRVGIKALKMVYGNECTYNELDRLIQPMHDDFRAEILSELRGRENQVPLLLEYTRNMAGSQKMQEHAMQTYSNLYDYLTELTSNKYIQRIFCRKSTFNIDDVLRNGEIVLVNGAYGTLQTLTYTVGRLYLNLLRASTFRRNLKEKVRPHQLTVDEIEMFADEEFSTFMEMAREFEMFVNVIHQGNVQLDDVSKRLGSMVKQNAVQKFILAGLDPEDAEYYADMIGEEYQVGKSSGTDEMSTTGFKTNIKEEKRYIVMPKVIQSLKGFNPVTGEPGECLFRGVQNNVRLDPVIGLIYPLPKELFAPLNEHNDEDEDDTSNREGNEQETQTDKDLKEEQIKENALQRKTAERTTSDENEPESVNDSIEESEMRETTEEKQHKATIRNSAWDSDDEEIPNTTDIDTKTEEREDLEKKSSINFRPAMIDNTALKFAEEIKNKAEEKRKNKGNSV
jgi:hypothetical protein